ncbi:expressed unknown protein [Seminavis robusta]|uniref:Uncharacterized protein n=1 Tax=Seminavis robusta TaxID=568900 RepID=A0A9N8DYT7_9STRA|nr:expressed unknown protein [Seminavis robusta]|eukprot:Sro460_g147520.1 n/a (176) ;mRNA; r:34111-34638
MKGPYTFKKPHNSKYLAVVNIDIARPSRRDTWGFSLSVDRDSYSAQLREQMAPNELQEFADEADKALKVSKLAAGGLLSNLFCVLSCWTFGGMVKVRVDDATDRAVDALFGVAKKWNIKFMAEDRSIFIRVKHLKSELKRNNNNMRASGTMNAALDNAERFSDIEDEIWLEFDIV